jgi:hypothetical protein
MSDEIKDKKMPNLVHRNDVATLFADAAKVSHRRDGLTLIQFMSSIPNVTIEQSRVMMTDAHAKKIVDVLCESLDYYPTKTEKINGAGE